MRKDDVLDYPLSTANEAYKLSSKPGSSIVSLKSPGRGFYRAFAHFSLYKNAVSHAITENPDKFITSFVRVIDREGSLLSYRAAIRHFLCWLDTSDRSIWETTLSTVLEFKTHNCDRCDARFRASPNTRWIIRLVLFLQLHGQVRDYGWTSDFPNLCDRFRARLISEGASQKLANESAKVAIHFVVWMSVNGIDRSKVTGAAAKAFAQHHCHCGLLNKKKHPTDSLEDHRALISQRFLRFVSGKDVLFDDGRLVQRRKKLFLSDIMVRYATWLREQRGLRPVTVDAYLLDLAKWLPVIGENASEYSADRIRRLAVHEVGRRSPISQSRFISSIRNYLKFCIYEGRCSADLLHVLISRRSYKLASVPRRLEPGMVQQVINSVNVQSATGLRDRAILLLLAELGLRAAEVSRLKLTDLDWQLATIRIDGKGGRAALVPLTQRSGDAILLYLLKARPESQSDRLFLRMRRPHVPFSEQSEVSNIAHRALVACGLRGGSHIFRHTLATELLQSGRTIEDVATVLRHTSVQTTTIYAKVNAPMLQRLAVPWIGSDR